MHVIDEHLPGRVIPAGARRGGELHPVGFAPGDSAVQGYAGGGAAGGVVGGLHVERCARERAELEEGVGVEVECRGVRIGIAGVIEREMGFRGIGA